MFNLVGYEIIGEYWSSIVFIEIVEVLLVETFQVSPVAIFVIDCGFVLFSKAVVGEGCPRKGRNNNNKDKGNTHNAKGFIRFGLQGLN